MDTGRHKLLVSVSIFCCLVLGLAACARPSITATTPFPTSTPIASFTPSVTPTIIQQPPAPTSTLSCEAGLTFVSDATIPDNTQVSPGSSLDKQWVVDNSGTCNWDNSYRLHLISGDALGASTEQALYPARAGTQATLRILFTAPTDPGTYVSEWQAFDPSGIPFGDSFYIKVLVSP